MLQKKQSWLSGPTAMPFLSAVIFLSLPGALCWTLSCAQSLKGNAGARLGLQQLQKFCTFPGAPAARWAEIGSGGWSVSKGRMAALSMSDGSPEGDAVVDFNPNKFVALQLIGADPIGEQGFPFAFLGPTISFDEDSGFSLGSRLDFVDGSDAEGLRRAIPIPLAGAGEKDLLGCLRSYEAMTTPRVKGRQLSGLEKSQAAVATSALYESLPFGDDGAASRREVVASVLGGSARFETALDVVEAIWRESRCEVERLVLEEEEALMESGSVTLGAQIVYKSTEPRTQLPRISRFSTTPGRGISLAVRVGAPIFIQKELWSELSCKVVSLGGPEDRTAMRVAPSQPSSWRLPQTPEQFVQRAERGREEERLKKEAAQTPLWRLRASDIRTMSLEQLRYALQAAGIPFRRADAAEQLIAKILPEMDEVERKIVQIEEAVRNEDYGSAFELQASQSQRGVIASMILQAVQEERFYDAAELQEEYEILSMARADVTQEEGAYDPYLDADDWYVRDLQNIQKRMQNDS